MCLFYLNKSKECLFTTRCQGRGNSGRARGAVKKLKAMETYKNYVCLGEAAMFTSKIIKETIQKFVSIRSWYLMKLSMLLWKRHLRPVAPLLKGQRQCPRSPASLLTVISSHRLAALPAKMSAFNSHMRQNAYCRNLKWSLEDLLRCYCYTIKTNSRTIR